MIFKPAAYFGRDVPSTGFLKEFGGEGGETLARPTAVTFTLAPGEEAGQVVIDVDALPTDWGDLAVAGDGLGEADYLEWWNSVDGWQVLVIPAATGPVLVTLPPALWGAVHPIRVRGVNDAGLHGASVEKSVFVPVQGETPIPADALFVSPAGSDSTGDGTETNPWRTLTYAATQILGGATIIMEDGVYTDTNQVTLPSGSDGNDTTVRARNRHGAIFTHANYATFRTGTRSYITIDGLYFLLNTGGGGVNSEGGHHITVKNCKQRGGSYHFFAGHSGDFFTVTDNDISGIRFSSHWSAISLYQLFNVTGSTSTDFHNLIARNKIYDCYSIGGPFSDGNGIILDDGQQTQGGGGNPHLGVNYTHKSLIDGNLVVNCGGKGIQVVWTDYATVRGNTCALNGNPGQTHDGNTWWAEISISISRFAVVINNIAITDPTLHDGNQREWADTGLGAGMNDNTIWKNNCGWNGTGFSVHTNEDGIGPQIGDNPLRGTDPEVVSATASALTSNYQLRAGSPCLDAGTAAYGLPDIDISGAPRVQGGDVDIGAYEGEAAYALVEQWITSAGLAAGQATWTGTVAGTVLTEVGAITTTTSGGTNSVLVFPGTSGNYMHKTDGIGPLPSGNDPSTTVLVASFGAGRFCGFSWGEPVTYGARTLGVQGTGNDTGEISADYYNAYAAGEDVVANMGMGIFFQTISALGVVRVYHGDQLVVEDFDRLLDTGTDRINLMRPYSSATPAAGQIGYIGVYSGVLSAEKRQEIVDTLNPLYLGITDAPIAEDVVFTANGPTTGTLTATLPTWRSVIKGVISTEITAPTVEQIDASVDANGDPASPFIATALTVDAEIEVGPIGLTPDATNYPHYYVRDAYGNVSAVATGADDDTPPITIPTVITPVTLTFPETVLSPVVLTTLTADQPVTTWLKVSGNAAFTVSTTGIVTLVSDLADGAYSFVVRATNSAGSFDDTIDVTVTDAAATADLAVRFGALTVTGEGGAQARDAAGFVDDFTSITSQPSTRWTISGGRLVATGSPAMASEQITAVVSGNTVAVNITVVPNMISVADETEFAAVSMTPAGTGDFTIHLRAETTITAAAFNSKISGTSVSPRALGGTLTVIGELVRGVPSANIDGKLRGKFFTSGAILVKDCNVSPSGSSDQRYANSRTSALIEFARSPTTDVTIDGIHTIGNPEMLTWPGKSAVGGTNDWGHDTWGALVRVNAVSGVSRPYKDGQITSGGSTGPDVLTFTGSGIKKVLMGIHSLGGGEYELQLSDKTGNAHSIANGATSGEGTCDNILIGDTVSGLDGFAATVIAPPSGVDTAGGYYSGTAAYTYLCRGPRWYDTESGAQNSGTANTVRNLTIRNCYVRACNEVLHPYAIQKIIIEQNRFGIFTQDFIKLGNPVANPNPEIIIRRNDFFSCMQSPTDLSANHNDYIQIFSGTSPGGDWKMQIHHNRFLCNGRGNGQGLWLGDGTPLFDSNIFGNVWVLYNGGNGAISKFGANCMGMHNTILIHAKEADLPLNWAPGNGQSMAGAFNPLPGTASYVGWNAIKRFQGTTIKTEKNFGLIGNTSIDQDDLFVGLAAVKPSRPWFFETYDELMLGAQVKLTGDDDKVGALGSNSDWSNYPYYVTTDFSHITHPSFVTPVYDPGVPSTIALGAVTGTGGTDVFSASAEVVTPGGAVYYVVYPSSGAEPSAPQIQAGLKADGTAATEDGTLGASTAGLKSIPATAIAVGTYKISFVQVNGAAVSPVKTATGTMTVVAAGITALTSLFTMSDSVQSTTLRESGSVTPAGGEPILICCGIINQTSNLREIATVATWGTPGRGAGTGTVLTPVAHGWDSRQTIKVFRVNAADATAVLSSFQIAFNDGVNADTTSGIEVAAFRVTGGNTTEAVGVVANGTDDPTNGTVITPPVTTGTANSVALYCGMAGSTGSGVPTITTTGATEIHNHATGSATGEADSVFAVAWEQAVTPGTYDCTFTKSFTGARRGLALEILSH